MNNSELTLRDIHIPDPIGWWPPAIGWWLVLVLVPLTLALLIWLYKGLTRKTALKSAKRLLLELRHDQTLTDYEKLCQLSILLRRTAISIYPRSNTASLTGRQWLELLDKTMPSPCFTEGPGAILIDAPYQKPETQLIDLEHLFELSERWMKAMRGVKS